MSDYLRFMAVCLAVPISAFVVAAALSVMRDRGRLIFRAAEAALGEDAALWRVVNGDCFRPTSYSGCGFTIQEHHPFKVFVKVGTAPTIRAGFGWAFRLSVASARMSYEKDKTERLNGLSDAMETLWEKPVK